MLQMETSPHCGALDQNLTDAFGCRHRPRSLGASDGNTQREAHARIEEKVCVSHRLTFQAEFYSGQKLNPRAEFKGHLTSSVDCLMPSANCVVSVRPGQFLAADRSADKGFAVQALGLLSL
jgi:hypothetical protein